VARLEPADIRSQAHVYEARRILREIPDRGELRPPRGAVESAIVGTGR
jgi:hypothetical protein